MQSEAKQRMLAGCTGERQHVLGRQYLWQCCWIEDAFWCVPCTIRGIPRCRKASVPARNGSWMRMQHCHLSLRMPCTAGLSPTVLFLCSRQEGVR